MSLHDCVDGAGHLEPLERKRTFCQENLRGPSDLLEGRMHRGWPVMRENEMTKVIPASVANEIQAMQP